MSKDGASGSTEDQQQGDSELLCKTTIMVIAGAQGGKMEVDTHLFWIGLSLDARFWIFRVVVVSRVL